MLTVTATLLRLHLVQFTTRNSSTQYVNSTLIAGPTESILIDAGFLKRDVSGEIDQIAATGTKLKAIFITHPHPDHYFGVAAFLDRFPGTPVYMTMAGLAYYAKRSPVEYQRFKKRLPDQAPDHLIMPELLPSTTFTVDGHEIVIHPDEQGDVRHPSNSFVWIPSLRAVIAGDIVFNDVHPRLPASDAVTLGRWHRSLERIAALQPTVVIAGHKRPGATNDPAVLVTMHAYLNAFDAARATAEDPDALVAAMKQQYPRFLAPDILVVSAKAAYQPASGPRAYQ